MLRAVGIWVFLISLLGMSCGAAEARVKSFLDKGEGKVGQSTRMCTSVIAQPSEVVERLKKILAE